MKRIIIFIVASLCCMQGQSAYAMQKKSTHTSWCTKRAVKLCSALCVGLACTTLGLQAHHTIVEKTKADYQKKIDQIKFDYENSCLQVSGTHPRFPNSKFSLQLPLCDPYFDTVLIEDIFNRRFGPGTELTSERVPCQNGTLYNGATKITSTYCISDPEQAAEHSADVYYKRKLKTD